MTDRPSVKRLVTEAAVIVGSILLAFAIDAGWDWSQERREAGEILEALHAEYSFNAAGAAEVDRFYLNAWAIMDTFLVMDEAALGALTAAERVEIASLTCNPASFDPVLGTTDALIGAGKLDLIRDPVLRNGLTNYLNLVEDAEEDIAYVGAEAQRLWVREIDLGGPWSEQGSEVALMDEEVPVPGFIGPPTAEELLRMQQDERLTGIIKRCHLNAGYYLTEIRRLLRQAEEIVGRIEAHRPALAGG